MMYDFFKKAISNFLYFDLENKYYVFPGIEVVIISQSQGQAQM